MALSALTAALLFSGCGDGAGNAAKTADGGGAVGGEKDADQGKQQDDVPQTNKSLSISINDEEMYASALEEFRKTHPDVDLQVTTYGDDFLAQADKLNTEIMAGQGPDLLILNTYGTGDVYKLMKAGAFAPLDEFIRADETWDGQDYVQGVLDAGKFGGSQYVAPLTFQSMVAVGAQERLEEAGFSLEEARGSALSFMKETAALYDTEHEGRVLGDSAQLGSFPEMLEGQFLDYAGEKLNVETGELEEACAAYKRMYEEDRTVIEMGDKGCYGVGEQLAGGQAYVYFGLNLYDTLAAAGAAGASATPVMVPMRTEDGRTLSRVAHYAGVRANSENKQNAYDLLRILMGEQAQRDFLKYQYCPVNRAVIESAVDEIAEETWEEGMAYVEMGKLDGSFLDAYKECLTGTEKCFFINETSQTKFNECMEPYYLDGADFGSCLGEFEDFIKVYLSE